MCSPQHHDRNKGTKLNIDSNSTITQKTWECKINNALGATGGRADSIPATNLDTLRGKRKGDLQHKYCGKELALYC